VIALKFELFTANRGGKLAAGRASSPDVRVRFFGGVGGWFLVWANLV